MNKSIQIIIISIILLVTLFFMLRFEFDFSLFVTAFKSHFFTFFLLIFVIVMKITLKNLEVETTATARAKFIYSCSGILYVMLEWETTNKGMVTVNAALPMAKTEIIRKFDESFPIILPDELMIPLSPKTYMNSKLYEEWENNVPVNFQYPEVSIKYSEKAPTLFLEILDVID